MTRKFEIYSNLIFSELQAKIASWPNPLMSNLKNPASSVNITTQNIGNSPKPFTLELQAKTAFWANPQAYRILQPVLTPGKDCHYSHIKFPNQHFMVFTDHLPSVQVLVLPVKDTNGEHTPGDTSLHSFITSTPEGPPMKALIHFPYPFQLSPSWLNQLS